MTLGFLRQQKAVSSSQIFLLIIAASIVGLFVLFSLPYFARPSGQTLKVSGVSSEIQSRAAGPYADILVERVIDGDTFLLENGEHVRLIGIDTPENRKNEKALRDSARTQTDIDVLIAMGKRSKDFLKGLVEDKRVRLDFDVTRTDKYGRLLAYAYLPDGTFVNARIVEAGYALPMTIPPNVHFSELFQASYQKAKLQKRGLWQDQAAIK
jgi:micrococcal nuclease